MDKNIKKVGIWIRVSTERQFEGDSPEIHETRAKAYAESKGWVVVEVYKLCVSGKTIMKYPETQKMLKDIETGHINTLIFSKLARLARNLKELIEIADYFKKYDADLVSLGESIDTSTPGGRLLFHVTASLAQWEREEISGRVQASALQRAKMGLHVGGVAPFGYKWINKKLAINREEEPIVKKVFETFLKCRKIKMAARILNESGYRTRKGLWSDTSVRRLLGDTTYKGIHIFNHAKSRGKGQGWTPKQKEEWIPIQVEPIMNENVWNKTNTVLDSISRKNVRKVRFFLLSGYVYCSKCSKKMYGYEYGRSKPYYLCTKCREKIDIHELESTLIQSLRNYRFNEKDLVGFPVDSSKELLEKKAELKKTLTDVEARMDELLELFHKKLINQTVFAEKARKIEERQQALLKEMPILEEEIALLSMKEHADKAFNRISTLADTFSLLTIDEKKAIIEDVLDSVKINKKTIEINLNYLQDFQKNINVLGNFNTTSGVHCRGKHEASRVSESHLCPANGN